MAQERGGADESDHLSAVPGMSMEGMGMSAGGMGVGVDPMGGLRLVSLRCTHSFVASLLGRHVNAVGHDRHGRAGLCPTPTPRLTQPDLADGLDEYQSHGWCQHDDTLQLG